MVSELMTFAYLTNSTQFITGLVFVLKLLKLVMQMHSVYALWYRFMVKFVLTHLNVLILRPAKLKHSTHIPLYITLFIVTRF